MKSRDRDVKILEQSRAIEILLTLYEEGKPMSLTTLILKTGGSTSIIQTRVLELGYKGFVFDQKELKFGGKRLISLTPLGKDVAELLILVDDIMFVHRERAGGENPKVDYFEILSPKKKYKEIKEFHEKMKILRGKKKDS